MCCYSPLYIFSFPLPSFLYSVLPHFAFAGSLAGTRRRKHKRNLCMYVRSESCSRGSFSGTSHPAQARIRFPLIYRARLDFCASNDLSYRIFLHFNRGICARLINRPRLISRVQISPTIPGITVVTAICLGHCRSNERPTAPIIIYPLPFAYTRILPASRARQCFVTRVFSLFFSPFVRVLRKSALNNAVVSVVFIEGIKTRNNARKARAFDQRQSLLYERGPTGIRSRENEEGKRNEATWRPNGRRGQRSRYLRPRGPPRLHSCRIKDPCYTRVCVPSAYVSLYPVRAVCSRVPVLCICLDA